MGGAAKNPAQMGDYQNYMDRTKVHSSNFAPASEALPLADGSSFVPSEIGLNEYVQGQTAGGQAVANGISSAASSIANVAGGLNLSGPKAPAQIPVRRPM